MTSNEGLKSFKIRVNDTEILVNLSPSMTINMMAQCTVDKKCLSKVNFSQILGKANDVKNQASMLG